MFVARRRGLTVPALVRQKSGVHPELTEPVTFRGACTIAAREGIGIRMADLPDRIRGRLIRVGHEVWIHIARHVPRRERHIVIMHEIAHFWRDDPGVMCAYSDDAIVNDAEEFCDIFAWVVTSPAREFVLPAERP